MGIDELKSLALKQCIDISQDYTHEEVVKFAPKSVRMAWEIGNDYLELERKKSSEKLKSFTL